MDTECTFISRECLILPALIFFPLNIIISLRPARLYLVLKLSGVSLESFKLLMMRCGFDEQKTTSLQSVAYIQISCLE